MTEKRSARLSEIRRNLLALAEELGRMMDDEARDANSKGPTFDNVSGIEEVKTFIEKAETALFQNVNY